MGCRKARGRGTWSTRTASGLGTVRTAASPWSIPSLPQQRLFALATIHVDDTRYAGDETSQDLWDELRRRLKFGKLRKATDGWTKLSGRWERPDRTTYDMESP